MAAITAARNGAKVTLLEGTEASLLFRGTKIRLKGEKDSYAEEI